MQTLHVLNADADLYTASEQYITIDTDTREITIPDNEKLFGVKGDLKTERKYFKCKKVVGDNLDLSKHRLYINYMNANKETSAYLVDDVKVDGDYITFSWLLYRSVTKYIGNVSFIVCAKSSNNKGLLQTDWNTTLATGTVKEGLEVDTATTEEYPDVIEQILNRLDGVEGGQITDEQMQNAIKKYFTVNPQKLADMQPDSQHRLVSDTEKSRWNNKSDFNGSYNSLTDKPTIPSKLSQLTEDNNHMTVTKAQRDKIDNFTGGTGTSITVDTALSATSVNPVQNKVVTNALNAKADKTELGIDIVNTSQSTITMQSGKYYVFGEMASINVTCEAVAQGKAFICGFEFSSGSTPTSLTLNKCTLTSDSDDVVANKTYEVNILNGSAIVRAR